jgi:protein phosphatase
MQVSDLDEAVEQLIELANRSGGPDNITCIVADVVDPAAGPLAPTSKPVIVGAASSSDGRPRTRTDSPAGRAQLLTQTTAVPQRVTGQPNATAVHTRPDSAAGAGEAAAAEDDEYGETGGGAGRRRWPVVTSILVILLIVIAGGGYAAWQYTRGQYYVGADAGHVVIYRGVNQTVAGLHLSSVYQRTGIPLSGVPVTDVDQIRATIPASNLAAAQRIVRGIRTRYDTCKRARAAVASWIANKPKPVKRRVRVGRKTVVKTITPHYRPEPTVPAYCPPQPGAAG